ncbi:MAG: NAD(P)H-binding protein [Deltaproteobacteria bacterium]|nr:NAD(P)H-binding protein [Deltaproteobacteria bacterium]
MAEKLERVLVTGANGHLGLQLLARLAELGEETPAVRAVVRSKRAAAQVDALAETLRPELAVLDYADPAALAKAAAGCSHAVHLVGIIKESATTRYEEAHEATCRALAAAAAAAGLRRIVYLSIFGADPAAKNPCLASKGRAEEILLAGRVATTILRLPMVLGPDDFASRSLRGQAKARLLPMIAGGTTLQQPIDSADLVAAVLACLRADDTKSLDDVVLELGGPESLSHRELVARAARLYGDTPRVLPVPLGLARALAVLAARLSGSPPLTPAMLEVLQHDDDIDPGPALARLGIALTPLDDTLRRYVGPQSDTQ